MAGIDWLERSSRCRSRQRYRSVLAARIDRLAEREKSLLQVASVVGKTVPAEVLKRVAGLSDADLASAVSKLAEGEFLYEAAIYPSIEYAFKHPLTQEVAYRSQLADRRSRTHAAVARAIAELYPEQLDERAALLAHHWEQAGESCSCRRMVPARGVVGGTDEPRGGGKPLAESPGLCSGTA